jgi:hypothetical protein
MVVAGLGDFKHPHLTQASLSHREHITCSVGLLTQEGWNIVLIHTAG